MVIRIPILFFLVLISSLTKSQGIDSLELHVGKSLDIKGQDTTIYEKPKAGVVSNFLFQFDNRNERYYDLRGRMNGTKIGLEFFKRVRTGVGIYGNNSFYQMNFPDAPKDFRYSARLNYTTWFTEVVLYRSFRWELSTAYAMGKGIIQLDEYDARASIPELMKKDTISGIPLYDFGVNSHFKIFPWFGLGFGVGYRTLSLATYPELQGPFSDPYFDFKVKVFLGYAYRGIFHPERIEAENNYYQQRAKIRKAKFRAKFLDR
jgi:hypothetical protein